jgi:hypothetical protein
VPFFNDTDSTHAHGRCERGVGGAEQARDGYARHATGSAKRPRQDLHLRDCRVSARNPGVTAFVFAYVLEGSVRSQLGDEAIRTYVEGQSWSEPPGAHHLVTENVSATEPARLLVVFIGDKGQPLKSDDKTNPN